ncbi:MAG: Zn-dependent hydrolase [Steroidobacteraceae bacterium]|nr:Zn-dependent hydrolase [Steroidobacteraceae bacterium]
MAEGTARPLTTDGDRLWRSLMDMAEIGATTAGGSNRLALTDADKAGRDLFVRWCRDVGCSVEVDAIGNIFARREGVRPGAAPVLIGSHLDTQATGGRFDGVYGVLAALEVIRTLNDAGVHTEFPIEAVAWTNEEGARFAPAMMGSAVWSGAQALADAHARTDRSGCRVDEELRRIGYLGDRHCVPGPVRAAFEVHIEQGPVLERAGRQIGVVTGIQGVRWFEIGVDGTSCHAGTTPMDARRDPIRALSEFLPELHRLVDRHQPLARLTVGRLAAIPGAYNTVPKRATVGVDLRHPDAAVLDDLAAALESSVLAACERHGLSGSVRVELDCAPVSFAPECVDAVQRAADACGYHAMRMVSGAAHDSMHVARVAPTGMIFVPCEDGVSHNEAERARPEDLEAGCNVLLGAVLELR